MTEPLRPMTPTEFRSWRDRCGLSSWEAVAVATRTSLRTVYAYQRGERPIPGVYALACEAVEVRMTGRLPDDAAALFEG